MASSRHAAGLLLLLATLSLSCSLSTGSVTANDSGTPPLSLQLAGWGCGGDLVQAMGLLHCFSYEDARAEALAVLRRYEGPCPMASWIAAASFWHALWRPTFPEETRLALDHLRDARSALEELSGGEDLATIAAREAGPLRPASASLPYQAELVLVLEVLFRTIEVQGQREAVAALRKRLEGARMRYPSDPELACLWALAVNAQAGACLQEEALCYGEDVPQGHPLLPADVTHAHEQRTLYMSARAGKALEPLWLEHADHPGILHYIIHSYDYPALASLAMAAANHFHVAAPGVPHAHHMPAHIFIRRGHWTEAIAADAVAMQLAQFSLLPRAAPDAPWSAAQLAAGEVLHDEFLHSMDYSVYAYLQLGRDECARAAVAATAAARHAHLTDPPRGASYSMLASTARYAFDTRQWHHAASLPELDVGFPYEELPPSIRALRRYVRALGHFYGILWASEVAEVDLTAMKAAFGVERDAFEEHRREAVESGELSSEGKLWEVTVRVQHEILASCQTWLDGDVNGALVALRVAADLEDAFEKPSIKPNVVFPAREQLGLRYLWLLDSRAKSGSTWTETIGEESKRWLYAALQAFSEVLRRTPRRLVSVYSAARAARELAHMPPGSVFSLEDLQRQNLTGIAHRHYAAVLALGEEAWEGEQPQQLPRDEPLTRMANSAFALAPEVCKRVGTHRLFMFEEAERFLAEAQDVTSVGALRRRGYFVLDFWIAALAALCCLAMGYLLAVQQRRLLAKKRA